MGIQRDFFTSSIAETLNGAELGNVSRNKGAIGEERAKAIKDGINPLIEICKKHHGTAIHYDHVFSRFLELDGGTNMKLGEIALYTILNPHGGIVTVLNKVDLMDGGRTTELYYEEGKPFPELMGDLKLEHERRSNQHYSSSFDTDKEEPAAVSA